MHYMFKKIFLKNKGNSLKKSFLKKQSSSYNNKKSERIDRGERIMLCFDRVMKDRVLYDTLGRKYWISEESGKKIYNINTMNLHHILLKSKYEELADVDENIMILTQEEHSLAHSDINKVPNVKLKTQELKEKYLYNVL